MYNNPLIPVSILSAFNDEPRILDVDLAERLGLSRESNIRSVIVANRYELELHGNLHAASANSNSRRGRPGKAYYLNEGQALVLCALSRTPTAARIRKALIDVFQAYRAGKVVHVKEHRRRLPVRSVDESSFDDMRASLALFRDDQDALIDVLARCIVRLDRIEHRLI